MTIIDALDDADLFAPHFRGSTWGPWRAFLAALFGLPLSPAALELYRTHTGRTNAPAAPFNEAALVIGRRGGKSRVLATIAAFLACFRDYTPHLAPGEVATIAVIAADRRQARSIFRFLNGLLDAVPMLAAMVTDRTAETVKLSNRVVIEIATASFRVTRGYTFAAVLADETAFWRSEDSAAPDVEVFRALRPGLATIPGAILLNASSPYRRRGVLWEAFKRHHGVDGARVLVWQAPSLVMNPALDPAVVAEAYEDDPAAAAAEFGAEFRTDLADFVAREAVEGCVIPGRRELPKVAGVGYVAFVDNAGGGADSFALAIGHRAADGVAVLDVTREVRGPCSPEAAIMGFCAVLRSYGLTRVTGDRYAGEYPVERYKEHGIVYEPSDRTKGEIYLNCLPLLNSGRLELLDDARLVAQFCGLERRTARGGRDSIDHAPGAHDDLANAAAGALLLAADKPDVGALWAALAA